MINLLKAVFRFAGIDRAVFFSNAAQVMRLVTGPISMALVLRYLTPEIQGYFYTFSGIVAMQIFLEMGFSQNILQFASFEFAKLNFTPRKTLEGDLVARSRLMSLGRLAFAYYAVAALVFLVVVGIGGHIFFSISGSHGIAWQGAWWTIVICASVSLAVNPAWALLEGCNRVATLAQFRFWSTLAGFLVNAILLMAGAGIYASALGSVFTNLLSVGYLLICWHPFFRQFLQSPRHGTISWRHEIWPFQWRIAVSWMSGYFIFDIMNPVAFYFCGAAEAGRFGMSFQLVRTVLNVATSWIYTKCPRFGMLVAARKWKELDSLWRRSTAQAFLACVLGMILLMAFIPVAGHFLPQLPRRLAGVWVMAWLGGAEAVHLLIHAMVIEVHAYRREPFMWWSVICGALTAALIVLLVRPWGVYGEAVGYALALGIMFIPALKIYLTKRLEYRRLADDMDYHQPGEVLPGAESPCVI